MAVLPKYQLKQLFEAGDLITQLTLGDLIDATYNPTLVGGTNIILSEVITPSGTTITINSSGGGSGTVQSISSGNTQFINTTITGNPSVSPNITSALNATGTPSRNTYLRGDNTWAPAIGSGFPGATGAQGTVGSIGATGAGGIGATGLIGATGSGATGLTGATGNQGSIGNDGATGFGFTGATGIGATGAQGTIGNDGATGFGFTGATGIGATGAQGTIGNIGATGFGNIGATGIGSTGFIGATGFGNIGATGAGLTGATGNQGSKGSIGATGAGFTGATGFIGSTGFNGSTGFIGSTGIGSTGFTGSTGVGATGSIGSTGFIGATGIGATGVGGIGATGFTGSTGFIGSTGIGATGVGGIGATGFTGSTGFIGSTGAGGIGATGFTGSTGFIGATGIGSTGFIGSTGIGATGFTGSTGIGATGAIGSTGFIGATGAGGVLIVKDEGVQVGATGYTIMNFVGTDVLAEDSGTPGQVNVYIPTPTFLSHFNTTDGTNNATMDANLYPFGDTPRISKPTTEGNPFKTGSAPNNVWQTLAKASYESPVTTGRIQYDTVASCTGFSADATGDAKFVINVYDANGTSVLTGGTLDTSATNAIYQTQTFTNGTGITLAISNYAADLPTKFSADVSIVIDAGTILTANGLDGGRYHVGIVMTTDTATDGGGVYSYFGPNGNSSTSYNGETNDVFFDSNPSTPSINGTTTIVESSTPANIITKYLSGVQYYTITSGNGSQFELDVSDIDNFNANTQGRGGDDDWNFRAIGTNYGLPTLQLEAWGPSVGTFTGVDWPDFYNASDVAFDYNSWAINNSNFRFRNNTATVSGQVYDPWNSGNTVNSSNAAILIDTYAEISNSTLLRERFDDEQYRLERTGTYTAFVPTATLTGSGLTNQTGSSSPFCQACTVGSNIIQPSIFFKDNGNSPQYASATGSLTPYKPDKTTSNPDYSGASYQVTSTYHRLMKTTGSLTDAIASFELEFSGDPLGSTFFNDLVNEDIKVYIRKANEGSGAGNIGYSAIPLSLHGSAPFTTILDPPSGIDTASAACRTTLTNSNTIAGTFGGFDATEGFYIEVQIVNSAIRIDQIVANIVYANGTIVNG
jgi:hypothetical protein